MFKFCFNSLLLEKKNGWMGKRFFLKKKQNDRLFLLED